MGTVTIDGEDYTIYGEGDEAIIYHAASYHGATWRDAATDDQNRALVTATRILDRQAWQTLYNTFALRDAVTNIQYAAYELALALLEGSDVQTSGSTAERIQSMSAGSVSITNYRGVSEATRFPQIVQELLRDYLGGEVTGLMSVATGVDTETIFPVDLGYSTGGM